MAGAAAAGLAAGRARAGAPIGGARNLVRRRAFANGPRRSSWFAVAYGTGVVLYFTAERKPALWAAAVPVAVCALGAVLLRQQIVPHKIVLNVIALGLFGIALGFAVATLETSLIQHTVLRFPASGVTGTASSNCARKASTPIVSWCASTASTAAGAECPLVAQSGHRDGAEECPLSGGKRTLTTSSRSRF